MSELQATIHQGDCVTGMAEHLSPASVDLCVTSIPFSDLFSYSGKVDDMGNCKDGIDSRVSEFGLGMRFFIEQLLRVMKPGCNTAIHIQQLIAFKNKHGYMGKRDFRGAVIDLFMTGGFDFIGEFVIQKNPQMVAKRQNLHSLMFATGYRNARKLAPTCNDYVLIFQKPGDGEPVPALYHSEKNPGGWMTTDEWIRDAHGVWTDISEVDVLENWQHGRDVNDEKHVCPLQLEVVRRLVRYYSNAGDLVLDPYMGIGTVAWVAVEQGRSAVGFELKESYHRIAVKNTNRAMRNRLHNTGVMDMFTYAEQQATGGVLHDGTAA